MGTEARRLTTTFRTGGGPDHLVDFPSAVAYLERRPELGPHRVVGGGSNLVVADSGVAGTIVTLRSPGSGLLDVDGDRVRLDGAGRWHETALDLASHGLAGVETLVGIPGTVGGAIVQNIGAYGHEIGEIVERVKVLSTVDGTISWLTTSECDFGYRDSRFKSSDRGKFVVLEVDARLRTESLHAPIYDGLVRELTDREGPTDDGRYGLASVHAAVLALRHRKNMVWTEHDTRTWGAGSFFVNPTVTTTVLEELRRQLGATPPSWPLDGRLHKVSAGWLVESAGYRRGYSWETVALADGHALGLVNRSGDATSAEVLAAANEMGRAVTERSGVRLLAEPVLMGFPADVRLDFDAHVEP